MGLGVRYGFTQSIPGLNPWWDYIPCNRTRPLDGMIPKTKHSINRVVVRTKNEQADGPALRPDGPRSGRSAPVGRTVRACAE
ncbi:hypothetical protein Zm00014a_029090 [Zea mays]|uniref:Uncharacterized protein n=1 Tax=Zea mays TaxID=4577 RepID=A0A3L6ECP2_MAIZE|nr:hypothetical protein Zm00014a_029090 [Zea mays]